MLDLYSPIPAPVSLQTNNDIYGQSSYGMIGDFDLKVLKFVTASHFSSEHDTERR